MIFDGRERCNANVPPVMIRYVLQKQNFKGTKQFYINYYYVYKNLFIISSTPGKQNRKLFGKAGKRK